MRRALLGRALLALALLLPLAASAQEGFPIGPGPGQYPGTATNDDAAAGKVGEYVSSSVLVCSAVSTLTAYGAIQARRMRLKREIRHSLLDRRQSRVMPVVEHP
jgi:hypothetical protein